MDLFAVDDPVFVVDLSPQIMESCRQEMEPDEEQAKKSGRPRKRGGPFAGPHRPVRLVALVFDWQDDPVLIPIRPTRDTRMLDTMARLLRMAMLTGRSVAYLATELGDTAVRRLFFSRRLPRFMYEGFPEPARHRVPRSLDRAVGLRPRSGPQS